MLAPEVTSWSDIPWPEVEANVHALQRRIYRAEKEGNRRKVRSLQRLLLRSTSAKLLALRRVTQDNQGKKTPGSMAFSSWNPRSDWPWLSACQAAPLGMKFVKVPKETFWMGWSSDNPQSKQVTIERDFELAAYTVTQEQWQAVMGNNPSYFSRQGNGKDAVKDISDADLKRFPVESVSWDDVQKFLAKLNEQEKMYR
jgi:formylglycine-generating enzyme required for sulfatase activity